MSKDRFIELVSRKLAGEANTAEQEELAAYLQNNPGDQYFTELLTSYWKNSGEESADDTSDEHFNHILKMAEKPVVDTLAGKIIYLENNKSPVKIWIRRIAVAAVFIITVLGFAWMVSSKNEEKIEPLASVNQREIKTNYGSKTSMVLPDGTKVWLNAGSKMTYDKEYGIDLREVNLTGEAYFDVVQNGEKPFIIHAGNINIKVLGTAFNVRSYPDEKNTETSLVRGSLEITLNGSSEKYILKPSEKLIVSNNPSPTPEKTNSADGVKASSETQNDIELTSLSILPQDSTVVETSWVYNRLVFRSETFEQVALKMERWYAVDIIIKNEKLKTKKFTGVFENETVSQALDAIQLITPFSYDIINEQIIISK